MLLKIAFGLGEGVGLTVRFRVRIRIRIRYYKSYNLDVIQTSLTVCSLASLCMDVNMIDAAVHDGSRWLS